MDNEKRIEKVIPRPVLRKLRQLKKLAVNKRAMSAVLARKPEIVTIQLKGEAVVSSVADDFTAVGMAIENLDLVVAVLKKHKIPYFIVPGFSLLRHRLGVREADRGGVLRALQQEYEDSGVYVATKLSQKNVDKDAKLITAQSTRLVPDDVNAFRIYQYVSAKNGVVFGDAGFGCDVEFWADGSDLDSADDATRARFQSLGISVFDGFDFSGSLVAPRRNKVASLIPKSEQKKSQITIGTKKYATFAVFNQTYMDEITFPIDVVYTWVDGNDPVWQKKYAKYRPEAASNPRNNSASRYTNRDELKYSLRSLSMYGSSFVRNVYIVTDGQTPKWLNTEAPGIKVVDHKEIFADKSALPIFNSHAISSQIHHIPGLSDRYVFFNDDVFLGRPVSAHLFFYPNGIAKIMPSKAQFGVGAASPNESAPSSAGKNVRKLLLASQGRYITNKFTHVPIPQIKQVSEAVESQYKDAVDRTMKSRFRDPGDVTFATGLHHNHAFLTGNAVETKYKIAVVDIANQNAPERLSELSNKKNRYSFCLNDTNTPEDRMEEVETMLQEFLESYFPFSSPWEK